MNGLAERGTASALSDDRPGAGHSIPEGTQPFQVQVAKAERSTPMCENLAVTRTVRLLRVPPTVYYWWQEAQRRSPIASELHHREEDSDFNSLSHKPTLARTSHAA